MIYQKSTNILFTLDSQYECVHKNSKIMAERLLAMKKMFLEGDQGQV